MSIHGTSGPLHIEPHDLAPISERVKESMVDVGLPYHPDMFSTGETPHGCGDVLRTVHQGIRSTAADFITKGYKRANITIKTEVVVDKILFSNDSGEPTATGVSTISKAGGKIEYQAKREIIVTAGAYCSPTILMRSGVGPKEELQKHGIECRVDLPGVGQNLQDHCVRIGPFQRQIGVHELTIVDQIVFIFYEVSEPNLTNDYLAYHNNAMASTYQLYKEKKTGFLSTFPFGTCPSSFLECWLTLAGIFGYARLDERLQDSELWRNAERELGRDPMGLLPNQPNMEFWNTELYGGPKQYDDFPIDGKHTFAMCNLLFNQKSRGFVRLKSADPSENPVVDHNYLADPLDLLVMTEACRFANEMVMNGKGTKGVITGSWPANLTHHKNKTREEWIPHVKQHATTCEFGFQFKS